MNFISTAVKKMLGPNNTHFIFQNELQFRSITPMYRRFFITKITMTYHPLVLGLTL